MVRDALWAAIAPLLPGPPSHARGGRPRVPDRAALAGILFVLRTGTPWALLLQEMGCGSGSTCWRRLRDWQAAGVWRRLERDFLNRLGTRTGSTRAGHRRTPPACRQKGGPRDRPNPTDRGKTSCKRHLVVDRNGVPLITLLTAANVNDSVVFEQVMEAIPPIHRPRGEPGRPRRRPAKLHADKGYDKRHCRRYCWMHHIGCRIARIGVESSERLGRHRWVVERTGAWFNRFRRLRIRDERRADIHAAFIPIATALILLSYLHTRY